jgi:hypothetical protein
MSLKDWIDRRLGNASASEPGEEGGLSLAVAALLVEVLGAAYDVAPAEPRQVGV